MQENKTAECYLVSVDFSHGKDAGIMLVGKQTNGVVDIVNAFQGEDALEIYQKLTTKKEKEK